MTGGEGGKEIGRLHIPPGTVLGDFFQGRAHGGAGAEGIGDEGIEHGIMKAPPPGGERGGVERPDGGGAMLPLSGHGHGIFRELMRTFADACGEHEKRGGEEEAGAVEDDAATW